MASSSFVLSLMVVAMLASAQAAIAQNDAATIHVYGPGGPAPAMTECANTFSALSGANIVVTSGPTSQWMQAAMGNADLVYSGSASSRACLKRPGYDGRNCVRTKDRRSPKAICSMSRAGASRLRTTKPSRNLWSASDLAWSS